METQRISIALQAFYEFIKFINSRVKSLLDGKRLTNNLDKFGVDQTEK